jgi:hypothetical protein
MPVSSALPLFGTAGFQTLALVLLLLLANCMAHCKELRQEKLSGEPNRAKPPDEGRFVPEGEPL